MDTIMDFTILELAVMYTALKERHERLQKLFTNDNDVKLEGEIESTKLAIEKVKKMFISKTGNPNFLD